VICLDLDESVHETASEIGAGEAALAVTADVSVAEEVDRAVGLALERYGRIDAVYANAGITGEGGVLDATPETWERTLSVNLTGVFHTVRATLPGMRAQGGGSVITQASSAGLIPLPNLAPYSAAKSAVVGLTRQMALDFAPHGVRVNAICPGTVVTPLVTEAMEKRGSVEAGIEAAVDRTPLGRLGRPEEVAALATFLASDESAWITGAVIPIDGGLTLSSRPS